ncbi:hypothetical protein ABID37_001224 [Aquamicrobium terrae]|uniref:Uncharacterized protein n=1 Tax=Aquamicrobium terrae TaxID=1324945 RepID=A0ABV2MW61_9HYPH
MRCCPGEKAEQAARSAQNRTYDPLNLRQLGLDAQFVLRERLGSGSHVRLNLYRVYDEINDGVWSNPTGNRLVGNNLCYGNKLYKTIEALCAEAAESRIGWQCEKKIIFLGVLETQRLNHCAMVDLLLRRG